MDELFSLLKFLRPRPLNDWQAFKTTKSQSLWRLGDPYEPSTHSMCVLLQIFIKIYVPSNSYLIFCRSFWSSCSDALRITSSMESLSSPFRHAICLSSNANSIPTSTHFIKRFQNPWPLNSTNSFRPTKGPRTSETEARWIANLLYNSLPYTCWYRSTSFATIRSLCTKITGSTSRPLNHPVRIDFLPCCAIYDS